MLFEMGDEFMHVRSHGFPGNAEFGGDPFHNVRFGSSCCEEFQDARTYEVEAEHLAVANVQDHCTVVIVCAAKVGGDFHGRALMCRLRNASNDVTFSEGGERRPEESIFVRKRRVSRTSRFVKTARLGLGRNSDQQAVCGKPLAAIQLP